MAFVASRRNVGYFGYLCDRKLMLFTSPFAESESFNEKPVVINNPADLPTASDSGLEKTPQQSNGFNCASISNCGAFIAASVDSKQLHLWRRSGNECSIVSTRTISRRCLQMLFTHSGSDIIAVDRGGDVFSFSVNEANACGKFVLGHVCAILQVELTADDDYILTCDRDGKIRVSCYPNAYTIASYCLGHREFVSALKTYPSIEMRLLLSGSGDGTLRFWKYDEGKEIMCRDLTEIVCESNSTEGNVLPNEGNAQLKNQVGVKCIKYCSNNRVFAMTFYTCSQISIFQVSLLTSEPDLQFIQQLTFKSVPQDIYFDSAGYLWILFSSRENSVVIFKSVVMDSSRKFVELEGEDYTRAVKICSEISNNWTSFPAAIDASNLYKQTYIGGFAGAKQSPLSENSSEPKWKKNKVR